MTLQAGDVLLYRGSGLFGWLIRLKTWHDVGHVEVYVGHRQSVASRDGKGVDLYPLRTAGLITVCRPKLPVDVLAGLTWFHGMRGTPYGWLDLANFLGLTVDKRGIVCSPFATLFCRAEGLDPFNGEPANDIAPFEFALSPVFQVIPYAAPAAVV